MKHPNNAILALASTSMIFLSACAAKADSNELQLQLRAVACSTETKACVDLPVPDAAIVVTQGSLGIVGRGTTDKVGTAQINLAHAEGIVHVSISSPAIKSGQQDLDINIDGSLVASTINVPLAADLQPGP